MISNGAIYFIGKKRERVKIFCLLSDENKNLLQYPPFPCMHFIHFANKNKIKKISIQQKGGISVDLLLE
jgi:hypothetical protein